MQLDINTLSEDYNKKNILVVGDIILDEYAGIQTLKNKETDRIKAAEDELKKLNTSKIIKTYKDHRMAMSFAPLSLKFGELIIKDIEVVSKSYSDFWKDLQKGGFTIVPSTD